MPGPALRISAARAATILIQPLVSATLTPIRLLTRLAVPIRRQFFTADDVDDAQRLHQILYRMQESLVSVAQALGSPIVFGNIVQNVATTNGANVYINHGLGRPYVGWFCTRAQSAAWSGYETALPTLVTSAQQVALHATATGTFDFCVF